MFDLKILPDYPPLLFEDRFKNLPYTWLHNESPDTTRTALSARAANVGEHRKTENELPPPHVHPWPHSRQCYYAAKKPDSAYVCKGSTPALVGRRFAFAL